MCIIAVLPPTVNPFQQKSAKKIPPPEFRQAGQSILACYRILFHITHQTGQSQADLRHIGDQHQHSKNRGKIGDQLFEHRFDLDAPTLTPTNSVVPTGGVMVPMHRLKISMMPKWMVFMPKPGRPAKRWG
mgnify:CR=1 FL=1